MTPPARTFPPPMKACVTVMPKKTVLDPQGTAVRDALHHLGLPAAGTVRVGKFMEIDLDASAGTDRAALEQTLHGLCRDLLSNPVIEDYQLEIQG
jgi:phosphoribosylformylglycinamidine synthase PurS subunit